MHRLPLVLCAIAVIGSVLSAVLFFRIGNSKQVLELRLSDASARAAKLDADLAAANGQNGTLKEKLGALDGELQSTKTRLVAADTRVGQLEREVGDVKSVLSVYESTVRALGEEVTALREDLEDSRNSNASPEAVLAYRTTIAELERQLAVARNGAAV